MSNLDMQKINQCVTQYLESKGVHAVEGWEEGTDCDHCVVVVTMKSCQVDSAGMGDYLGEREDPETGRVDEVYGHRCFLTLGLDVFAPPGGGEKSLQDGVNGLLSALGNRDNTVLQVREFSSGATQYDVDSGRLSKNVEMKSTIYLYYIHGSDEPFIDFILTGEVK